MQVKKYGRGCVSKEFSVDSIYMGGGEGGGGLGL